MKFDFKNPDYTEIYRRRSKAIIRLKEDQDFVAALKIHYSKNPIDFINDWIVTYDPKRKLGTIPLILFPRQEEYILWLMERLEKVEDGVVEKSREVGLTEISIGFTIWAWLYVENIKIGWGSRKQDLVDRIGDPDSIFEKMRSKLRFIPKELMPVGFSEEKNAFFMKLINPENGNTVIGEAGDNIGRGGRNTIYFKDESAFYERPNLIEASLSENADIKIDISTSNGAGIPFHDKIVSGIYPIFVFDWRDDPRKDQDWYNDRVAKLGSLIVAREIDRDHTASIPNIVIPQKWVEAAVNLELNKTDYLKAGFDVSGGGIDKNALAIVDNSTCLKIEQWQDSDSVSATYSMAEKAKNCNEVNFDAIGVGDGAKGTLQRMTVPFVYEAVYASNSASATRYNSDDQKDFRLWSDVVINLRAELWWKLRQRFEKTYLYVTEGREFDHSELISIPDDPVLKRELSQLSFSFANKGKIKIESKEELRLRGVSSPNMADALVLAFKMQDVAKSFYL